MIFLLRETGGKSTVFLYSVYLFRSAGVTIDPFISTLYFGVARLISIFICAIIIDKIGRKILFLVCTVICAVALILSGGVLLIEFESAITHWVPLIGLIIFVISYSIGMSPVPWPLLGELLPLPVKPISTSIVCFTYSISIFTVSNFFPVLLKSVGLGYSLLLFSVSYILLALLVAKFLPETKDKNLIELELAFVTKQEKNDEVNDSLAPITVER